MENVVDIKIEVGVPDVFTLCKTYFNDRGMKLLVQSPPGRGFSIALDTFSFYVDGDTDKLFTLLYAVVNNDIRCISPEEFFQNPLEPNPSELVLFNLSYGFDYPLLPYLKVTYR